MPLEWFPMPSAMGKDVVLVNAESYSLLGSILKGKAGKVTSFADADVGID